MIKSFGKLEDKDIKSFEKKMKIKLPDDYKEFLKNNNGGSTNGDIICFKAEDIEETIALDVLFGIKLDDEDLCIEEWCNEYEDELLEEMIIIGHAIESGIILLINQEDWKGIYFWDSALDYEQSTEDDCIYKISTHLDSFSTV